MIRVPLRTLSKKPKKLPKSFWGKFITGLYFGQLKPKKKLRSVKGKVIDLRGKIKCSNL